MLTYELKHRAKNAVVEPFKDNMLDLMKGWALNQTMLDENVGEMTTSLIEGAVYAASGEEGLNLYREVNDELDKLSNYLERLTDKLEFCLSEILPPSRDALYHVAFTVTR